MNLGSYRCLDFECQTPWVATHESWCPFCGSERVKLIGPLCECGEVANPGTGMCGFCDAETREAA